MIGGGEPIASKTDRPMPPEDPVSPGRPLRWAQGTPAGAFMLGPARHRTMRSRQAVSSTGCSIRPTGPSGSRAARPAVQTPRLSRHGGSPPGLGKATSTRSRYRPVGVDYLIRAARITDVDRLVALCHASLPPSGASGAIVSADLLRQLVHLPQASVLVAEEGRELIGGAVLALRPSVRAGGYVGSVDLLAVEARRDVDRIISALIEELLRSARNKGCIVVEAALPEDPEERDRWDRLGFAGAVPHIERQVAADRAVARQT